jgi:pre-mRNA-splicing helicase BRR2
MAAAADYCNSYPAVEMTYALKDATVSAGTNVELAVTLERVGDEDDGQNKSSPTEDDDTKVIGKVVAPFFPVPKFEMYWLVVGDSEANSLMSIKKVPLKDKATLVLEFDAPKQAGAYELKVYLMCDSVLGADQVVTFRLDVQPGAVSESDLSSDSESGGD